MPKQLSFLDKLLIISKISIIIFVAFYLVGNFHPYYETVDGYSLATIAIQLSDGEFTISNELLSETGRDEFVPGDWGLIPTKPEAFPAGDLGFTAISTFFYIIAGNYGLFYLSPIAGILSLIIVERFSTKFFGKYAGFLALLFLSTNHLIYRSFLNLQTESLFLIFFILGCYSLLTFYKEKKTYSAVFSSIFFVIATTIRINGITYFPIEVPLIIIFMIFLFKKEDLNLSSSYSSILKHKIKSINKTHAKIILLVIIPWILFLAFWFTYSDYFFGDPLANRRAYVEQGGDSNISSLIKIDNKHIDNVKQFSKYLLPYQFPATYNKLDNPMDEILGKEWLGTLGFLIVIIMILISIILRTKRLEIITLSLFILGTVWFYASVTTEARAELGVPGRYMLPAFTLYYVILSYYIVSFFNWRKNNSIIEKKKFSIIIKVLIIAVLTVFFSFALYFIPPSQAIINSNFEIRNPIEYSMGHPPPSEGLSSNDVILADNTNVALEYDAIYFNIHRDENDLMREESIKLLNTILEQNYNVFVFKQATNHHEKKILADLINNHNFILTDSTNSFCKLENFGNFDLNKKKESDSICL